MAHHHFAFKGEVAPQIDPELLSQLLQEFNAYKTESGYINMMDYLG